MIVRRIWIMQGIAECAQRLFLGWRALQLEVDVIHHEVVGDGPAIVFGDRSGVRAAGQFDELSFVDVVGDEGSLLLRGKGLQLGLLSEGRHRACQQDSTKPCETRFHNRLLNQRSSSGMCMPCCHQSVGRIWRAQQNSLAFCESTLFHVICRWSTALSFHLKRE